MADMGSNADYEQWGKDCAVLAAVGQRLFDQSPKVRVGIPSALAEAALRAWQRDEAGDLPGHETNSQRRVRHGAGVMALIGLCSNTDGVAEDDYVVVDLPARYVGGALDAADAAGMIPPAVQHG
jgi:hypothetical protein